MPTLKLVVRKLLDFICELVQNQGMVAILLKPN